MSNHKVYADTHWSRIDDCEQALEMYLKMYEDSYNKTKVILFERLLGDVAGQRILDYGGGAGFMSVSLAKKGAQVVLVDAAANALKTAQYYATKVGVIKELTTIRSDTVPEELMKSQFDIVIAKDVIEHVYQDKQFIQDLNKCLKDSGKLLVSTQNSFSLNYLIEGTAFRIFKPHRKWMGWDKTHLRFYTPGLLTAICKDKGFNVTRYASVYIIPYKILRFFTIGKLKWELTFFKFFDLWFGTLFPFNRIGWNIIIEAHKN